MTTPLTRPLDDGPVSGQVSGVPLYVTKQHRMMVSQMVFTVKKKKAEKVKPKIR